MRNRQGNFIKKRTFLKRLLSRFFLLIIFIPFILIDNAEAMPSIQPYNTITLEMYVLDTQSGARVIPYQHCNANTRQSYGCTFSPNDSTREYPFTSNTITIGIENHIVNGIQQGYLSNVVPQELDPNHAPSVVRAQAIAARTYAYYQIETGGTLNNSTQFQAYIPYRYEMLTNKETVDEAVAGQVYLSLPGSIAPIAAFFSDNTDVWTDQGSTSYLKSVYDPISRLEGYDNPVHELGGMGQKAAGRWGAGRTGEYPGSGAPWSVSWETAQQILAHYYTGINFIGLNPDPPDTYRFNVLDLEGLPEEVRLRPGEAIDGLRVFYQNSGVFAWPVTRVFPGGSCPASGHPSRLSYHLYTADNTALACGASQGVNSPCFAIERYGLCQESPDPNGDQIASGVYSWISNVRLRIPSEVSPGTYNLRFDLEIVGQVWTSGLPSASHWPTQDVRVIVEDSGSGDDQGSVSINHPPVVYTTDEWIEAGQKFRFSWIPSGQQNYFDVRYRSQEPARNWDDDDWIQYPEDQNQPHPSFSTDIDCDNDRFEYQFDVRGQVGSNGPEGPWSRTNTQFKVFPYLDVNANQVVVFFELIEPNVTQKSINLYVTNISGGQLQWMATGNQPWLSFSPNSSSGDSQVLLTITRPSETIGEYFGIITFSTDGSTPSLSDPPQACSGAIAVPVKVIVVQELEKIYLPIISK